MPECPTCGKSLNTEQGVRAHHSTIHDQSLVHETTTCETCSKEFKYHVERNEGRFCSPECHREWLHNYMKGEDSPLYDKVERTCDECGETFKRQKSRANLNDRDYCSRECYHENHTGEDAPYWKGGKQSYYGEEWLPQRRKVLDRDDEQCQDCGMTRDQHYSIYGSDLEVHHKTPIRTFEDTSEANQLSNLITLCTPCHAQHEKK